MVAEYSNSEFASQLSAVTLGETLGCNPVLIKSLGCGGVGVSLPFPGNNYGKQKHRHHGRGVALFKAPPPILDSKMATISMAIEKYIVHLTAIFVSCLLSSCLLSSYKHPKKYILHALCSDEQSL